MTADTPLWLLGFYIVAAGAIVVCLVAVYVLFRDYLHEAENPPPRSEIRDRLRHLPKP